MAERISIRSRIYNAYSKIKYMKKKISLIGAGQIGGTLAHLICIKELADVVLFDVVEGVAKGKALDISQSNSVDGQNIKIFGTSNYKDTANSDVIIITAGVPRKPGMSRDDLLGINLKIIIDKTRKGGAEIVKFLGNGSAFYAPAASGVEMAESYLKDLKKTLPCAAYLNGEYGFKEIYAGVPVIIGCMGVEKIIDIKLDEKEKENFAISVKAVKELFKAAAKIDPELTK